jgi:hypothetical protein
MTTRNLPVNLDGDRCECGALTENGSRLCQKCKNRMRWLRRRTWHRHGRPLKDLAVNFERR